MKGQLVRFGGSEVFHVVNGQLRAVTSPQEAARLAGSNWRQNVVDLQGDIQGFRSGSAILAVVQGQLLHVTDPTTAQRAFGSNWRNVPPLPDAQLTRTHGEDAVFMSIGGQQVHIGSPQVARFIAGDDFRSDVQVSHANDAFNQMEQTLTSVGLGSLVGGLREFIINNNPTSDTLMLWLREQPQFRERFKGLFDLEQQNKALVPGGDLAANVSAYLQYEKSARQLLQRAGLPPSFYDQPEDFSNFIAGEVSLDELQSRVQNGILRVQQAPEAVKQVFRDFFGPQGDGALAAFFLDPDRAESVLLEQVTQAEIAGAGLGAGFDISQQFAQDLGRSGVQSFEEAQQGFNQAARLRHLSSETVSEREDVTDEDVVEAAFGTDATADELLRRRMEQRQARFAGGGGALAGEGGVIGLGSASS